MPERILLSAFSVFLALTLGCSGLPSHDGFSPTGGVARGVNLGNALEAPVEGEWGVMLEESYFEEIASAGFDTVRIPIRWSAHAEESGSYTIDETFFERIDWAIEQCVSRDMVCIINMHHYDELYADPAGERERFLAMWQQIAERYSTASPLLYLELLNEPNGSLSGDTWNALMAEGLAVIRASNPSRMVIVGPEWWNNLNYLHTLELPDDEHLAVTFHYYEPFQFTHQGAEWVDGSDSWLGTEWTDSSVERKQIQMDMDLAKNWADENGVELFLGEFGAYRFADDASRQRWTTAIREEAEARGIHWAYWEFCAGFGVYDPYSGTWRQELLDALIPSE